LQDILSLDYFLYECAECTKTKKKKKNGRIFFLCELKFVFIDAKNNFGNNPQQLERIQHTMNC